MTITGDFLKPYIKNNKRHPYYDLSVKFATDMLIHFDGIPPGDLLKTRRPSESETIHKYRMAIYECPTQGDCTKVQNSLMKIRKSQDWMIKYDDQQPASIAEGETLSDYMEKDFPKFGSFTNWFFQLGFKTYLTDANAVVLWMPMNMDSEDEQKPDNEFYEPYPMQFKSSQIIDYIEDKWYLLLSNDKAIYTVGNRTYTDGDIYYYVDDINIITLTQIDNKPSFSVTVFVHGLDDLPIVPFGGEISDETKNNCLSKSRLSPMLPFFREAVREYSDLQAEVVQHMHSTLWAERGQDCVKCNGNGFVVSKEKPGVPLAYKSCAGHGFYPLNPYENYVKRKPQPGETPSNGVPAGFITKDTKITELQDRRILEHRKSGLGAINMEWLVNPPQLNQSGTAKEVDRTELNNFVHAIAEDVIKFFDECYDIVCDYRYKDLIPSDEQREMLLPTIPVPEKYDILSENYLAQEIDMLQRYNVSPAIINASLIEYSNKKFNAEEEIKEVVRLSIELDPFASELEANILLKLQNDGITKENYIIHCNIKEFVTRALNEVDNFCGLEFKEQNDILIGYAKEILKSNSAKANVLDPKAMAVVA